MVKLLLEGLERQTESGRTSLKVYHVDAKLSSGLEAIGKFQWSKIFRILKYCVQAYWHRFAHGANAFYYVPAPGLRAAVYRDWIVMFFCRPLFRKMIFHWHAVGLGKWLDTQAKPWERKLTDRLLGNADLSIVLSNFARANANRFSPKLIVVIPNGIPDPCPEFEKSLLPERKRRLEQRRRNEQTNFTVLFIGACTAAKGLFAALDGVALLNKRLKSAGSNIHLRFIVAGEFADNMERDRFHDRIGQPDLNGPDIERPMVVYEAFVSGDAKNSLFRGSDCLVFPSRYPAEGQPVTIIEALAFGLNIVGTRWRGIPELLESADAQIFDEQDPVAIADGLEASLKSFGAEVNRAVFLSRYQSETFVMKMRAALTAE